MISANKMAAKTDNEENFGRSIDPTVKNQIREILESHMAGRADGEWDYCNGEDCLDLGELSLPMVKYCSKYEGKRVKLLYSIAELGDTREVPLLRRMLKQERNPSIAFLIKEIILRLYGS